MNKYLQALGVLLGSCDKIIRDEDKERGVTILTILFPKMIGEFCPDIHLTMPIGEEGLLEFSKINLVPKEATLGDLVYQVVESSEFLGSEHAWDESREEDILFYGYGFPGSKLVLTISGKYEDVEQWILNTAET